jgi:threonine dehydrogenase-like Zn-dependent dehydrogenase
MKAAVVTAPGRLEVQDVPAPRPGPYQALCELLYGATCTGTDTHIIDCVFPFASPLPTILGHESVGRVVEVGPKVRAFRVGDLVTRVGAPAFPEAGISVTWGGFAELGVATDHWSMARDGLPEGGWVPHRVNRVLHPEVRPEHAPMFTTWRETLSYAKRMGIGRGARVLVIGSGGNGLSYAVHAHNLGAERVAMAGSARAEPLARRVGVTDYVDYASPDADAKLRSMLGRTVDFVIDAVGKRSSADIGLPLLREGGTVGVYGIDDYGHIALGMGRAAGSFRVYNGGYDEAETHEDVTDLYLRGKLDASVWLGDGEPYPLSRIGDAFAAARGRVVPKALVQLST